MTKASDTSAWWQTIHFSQWSKHQWEQLCDGCARCCLHRLEDDESGEIYTTNVACRYLDQQTCRCTQYQERSCLVPDCVTLTPKELDSPGWLPPTCAYRLVAENRPLPEWHHLISNNPETVHQDGHSARNRVISETEADDLEHHLMEWPK